MPCFTNDEQAAIAAVAAADLLRGQGLEVHIEKCWGEDDQGIVVLQAVLRVGLVVRANEQQLHLDLAA